MRGDAKSLLRLMDGSDNRFIIPVYQRNYDWKEANCKQLFEDLLMLIQSGRQSHFFGSVVRSHLKGGSADDYLIIDGQQRLTTVSLLLLAIYKNIQDGNITPENHSLAEKIWEAYIVDKHQKEQRKIRLKPIKDDCKAYDTLVASQESDYIKSSNVTRNYCFFFERIKNLPAGISVDAILEAIKGLVVIDIFLSEDDDPQLIFESLNSTGLDLTEADKIRNYILMGLDGARQEEYYEKYWNVMEKNTSYKVSEFIRNYLTVKSGSIPSINEVYPVFKRSIGLANIEESLIDMLRYSGIYKRIINGDLNNAKANKILSRFNMLDISVMHPFLLSFIKYAEEVELGQEELVSVLSVLEVYVFRRLICGVPSNALSKIFTTLHKEVLKRIYDQYTYSETLIFLLLSKSRTSRFPDDANFVQDFVARNMYSMQSKSKYYMFDRLENEDSREVSDISTLSIEHIMPQKLTPLWMKELGEDYERIHTQWLNTIANLTLTGYNSEYSNKIFKEKKEAENGFNDSNLRLSRFLRECDAWGEKQLMQRQEVLAAQALKLWPYPTTSYQPKVVEKEIVSLADDFNFKGREIEEYSFKGASQIVDNWTDTITGVLKALHDIDSSIMYAEAIDEGNVWIFRETEKSASSHKEIMDDVYVGTGCDTRTKISVMKRIFGKYNIGEDELEFTLKPEKSDTEHSA